MRHAIILALTCFIGQARPGGVFHASAIPTAGLSATDSVEKPSTSAWMVSAPAKLVTLWASHTELQLTAGDHPLEAPRVAGSTLTSAETGAEITTTRLRLCAVGTAACTPPQKVPAGQTVSIELRLDTSELPAGAYTGSVRLTAEGAGVKSVDLRVEHTSAGRWVRGGAAILVGIVLSWLATTFLRRLSARATALLAAAALAKRAERLLAAVQKATTDTGQQLPKLKARLEEIKEAVSLDALKGFDYIPSPIPNPFVVLPDANPAYAQYLADLRAKTDPLAIIVEAGLPEAVAAWPDTNHRPQVITALKGLDDAGDTAQTAAAAKAAVATILTALRTALTGLQPAPGAATIAADALPSMRELEIQLQHVSLSAWGIWLLLTLVAGLTVLVLNNYAFGIPLDYCKCLLWGVGVPAAGQSLQQITASTISTNLSFPVK